MMNDSGNRPWVFDTTLGDEDFRRLSRFIEEEFGIKMPAEKKTMLEARLRKRLRHLGLADFRDYVDYVFDPAVGEEEIVFMMDVVTTNKTDFFREPAHFDFLFQKLLPDLVANRGAGISRPLMIWSAGCSTGEEPYSLAMVLCEFADRYPGLKFSSLIIATDLSTRVLDIARTAIYSEEKAEAIPLELKQKFLLRSKDRSKQLVRITPDLRAMVKFRRLNLMEDDFGFREPMDIIFCRNVIIYFDRRTQERLVQRFYQYLNPGGYIFMGHSETLSGLDIPLAQVVPTVYRK